MIACEIRAAHAFLAVPIRSAVVVNRRYGVGIWHNCLHPSSVYPSRFTIFSCVNYYPTAKSFCRRWLVEIVALTTAKIKLEEASTHKSAKTDPRQHWFCDAWPWSLTFWRHNKWVSMTHRGTFVCQVWLGVLSCNSFWAIGRKKKQTNTQTIGGENPTLATSVDEGSKSSDNSDLRVDTMLVFDCASVVLAFGVKSSNVEVTWDRHGSASR